MMEDNMVERLKGIVATVLATLVAFTGTAAASHGSVPCTIPEGLMPLFEFLHTLEQLFMVAGIAVGMIGFLIAAVLIMMPGEDPTRRGKEIAKNVFIGVVLLLTANMIMAFMISQFPVC